MTLRIFSAEAEAGLDSLILQDTSLKATASIRKTEKISHDDLRFNKLSKSLANANPDQIDLYYLEAVLVSTVWNKNDDVFLPEPTWAARHTPVDKQFNFMHDDDDIIGHITASYVEDFNGNVIPDDTPEDQIPSEFNIVTQAVIYTSRSNPEKQEQIQSIIASIEGGENKWKVSMECLFPHFDYAVLNKGSAEFKVIPRNEASASLSKHLRVYGGTGEYNNWKIGRALRGLTFSGKGLVDQPANERSEIRSDKTPVVTVASSLITPTYTWGSNYSVTASDKYSGTFAELDNDANTELESQENKMSEDLQRKVAQLESDLAEANKSKEEMKKKMDEQKDKETKALISQHEETIANKDSEIADLKTKLDDVQADLDTTKADLDKVEKEKAEAEKAVASLEEEKKTTARKAELLNAGASEEKADELVEKWSSASDEQFADVVGLVEEATKAEKHMDEKDKKDKKGKEKDKSEASDESEDDDESAEADVLDDIEKDDKSSASLNSDANDDDGDGLHKTLANYFAKSKNRR